MWFYSNLNLIYLSIKIIFFFNSALRFIEDLNRQNYLLPFISVIRYNLPHLLGLPHSISHLCCLSIFIVVFPANIQVIISFISHPFARHACPVHCILILLINCTIFSFLCKFSSGHSISILIVMFRYY